MGFVYNGVQRKACNVNLITKHAKEEFNKIPELHKKFEFKTSTFTNSFPNSFVVDKELRKKYCLSHKDSSFVIERILKNLENLNGVQTGLYL